MEDCDTKRMLPKKWESEEEIEEEEKEARGGRPRNRIGLEEELAPLGDPLKLHSEYKLEPVNLTVSAAIFRSYARILSLSLTQNSVSSADVI